MLNNSRKQKSKSKKLSKAKDLEVKSRCESANFKSEQAACQYVQITIKKVKNEKDISPNLEEEIPLGSQILLQSDLQDYDKLICEEVVKDFTSFTFNNSLEHQISQEDEQETLSEFMREQVKYEEVYIYKKNYLNNQKEIQSHMVAILFDWLIEVAHSFHFKRETLYLSINYVERYLLRQPNVLISKFQLLGVAAIFIAHKCEEIYPKNLKDFHRLIQDQYTIQEIEQMEVLILKSLDFRMYPNTPIFWLNYYTKLWDEFIIDKDPCLLFKERTNEAYYRYRELVQLFDVCLIDYQYKKNEKLTILSLIYLVVAKQLQIFDDYQTMAISQSEVCDFFQSDEQEYNKQFRQFILQSEIYLEFDRQIFYEDLNDVICQLVKYFILRFDNSLPRVLLNNQQFIDEMQHEELLSFQTYNNSTIETITNISIQNQ
ncbi:unnamed protein product [Paramecium octaurelia]|uniref:Cyclin-like domain-containing protein n=1 Tax=Paramecium octaurelia TaxID=43137 RepID=A0A8S1SCZ3_PAROT|nr:unnamed protein product [Paramecium octaurelia]